MKSKVLKGKIKMIWYVLPIVVTLLSLLYFSVIYNLYQANLTRYIYNEQIRLSSKVIDELDKINTKTGSVSEGETKQYLVSLIENIDSEPGIYAIVLDINYNIISKRSCEKTIDGYSSIINDADVVNSLKEYLTEPSGNADLPVYDYGLKVHWFSYPKHNTCYYIVIGILPNKFPQSFNIDRFTYGLLGMVALMIICAYYNIYLIRKVQLYNDKYGDVSENDD